MKTPRNSCRVVKTLAPDDRGAIHWARQYGDALVCVRHRTDAKGQVRHTTVELRVESTPIQPRSVKLVRIKTQPHEGELHALIRAAGGTWDGKACVWHLPSRVAGILSLRDRIVPE